MIRARFSLPFLLLALPGCHPPPNSAEARREAGDASVTGAETVTLSKYNGLANGMSYRDAIGIVGFEGTEMSSNDIGGMRTIMYAWSNPDGSNMNAMFQNDKMVMKAQYGLRWR